MKKLFRSEASKNKKDFASTTVISTNYVGVDSELLIFDALLGSYTLRQSGAVDVIARNPNGTKDKVVLHNIALTNLRQAADGSCGPAATGDLTGSDIVVELKRNVYKFETCAEKYLGKWYSSQLPDSAHNDALPQTIEDFITSQVIGQMGSDVDKDMWVGVAGVSGSQINGYITQLIAAGGGAGYGTNGTTVPVQAGTALTMTNIREEMAKAINKYSGLFPNEFAAGNVKLYMNTGDLGLFETQFAVKSIETSANAGNRIAQRFAGVEIIDSPNIPAGQMLVTEASNLKFMTNLLSDFEEVRIINLDAAGRVGEFQFFAADSYNVHIMQVSKVVYYHA